MHNMAKTIVKSQSIGDVKQGNNTKYDSCVSHFCKLVNCHRSFDSSFCSVKSKKIENILKNFKIFIHFFSHLILLLKLSHKIKNANHGVTLKIKNSAINLYIFV